MVYLVQKSSWEHTPKCVQETQKTFNFSTQNCEIFFNSTTVNISQRHFSFHFTISSLTSPSVFLKWRELGEHDCDKCSVREREENFRKRELFPFLRDANGFQTICENSSTKYYTVLLNHKTSCSLCLQGILWFRFTPTQWLEARGNNLRTWSQQQLFFAKAELSYLCPPVLDFFFSFSNPSFESLAFSRTFQWQDVFQSSEIRKS